MKLKRKNLLKDKAYIGGQWVAGAKSFGVDNPSTGKIIARVPDLGAAETKKAIAVAEKALPAWSAKTARERGKILRRWADLMIQHADDLAAIMTTEQGKPLAEAKSEIVYAASFLEWFGEEGRRAYGDVIPSPVAGAKVIVIKQPVGVCAMITPWNFPSSMITRKAGAALAAGCTVVSKPAEATPLSALAMAALGEEAGLPPGVFNIITSSNARAIGAEMCANPSVRKMSFTGSTEVGKILMKQSADTMKKVSFELGGNAPFIVFDDADIDAAMDGAIASKFRNAGQTCVCANRIYVQDKIYDEFAKRFTAKVKKLKTGDGFGKGVVIGPLINADGLAKVEEHVQDAVKKGAKIVAGGKKIKGLFFEPTVLLNAKPSMKLAQEETFGPVAPLFRFRDEDDAIKQANDTRFGLASYFYAKDMARVWRVAEALEYGMVAVNAGILSYAEAPFGGIKESGIGREGSKYGIDEYLEIKYIFMGL